MGSPSNDQLRLLYLVDRYTGANGSRPSNRWVKELHLSVLVYHAIERGLFADYDWAPSLIEYRGVKLYGKVSQEAHADLRKLQSERLIDKLHLSTCLYDTIRAYRAAPQASDALGALEERERLAFDRALACGSCGSLREVMVDAEGKGFDRMIRIVCPACSRSRRGAKGGERIAFFEIADVVYRTRPLAPGGLS